MGALHRKAAGVEKHVEKRACLFGQSPYSQPPAIKSGHKKRRIDGAVAVSNEFFKLIYNGILYRYRCQLK